MKYDFINQFEVFNLFKIESMDESDQKFRNISNTHRPFSYKKKRLLQNQFFITYC